MLVVKMAGCMTASSRCATWKDFCILKEKGTKGLLNETMEFEDSLAKKDPWAFVNDSFSLLKMVDFFEG